jgi:hypothetical protein
MNQYNVGAPFESIVIAVAGPFSHSDQETRHLLIAMVGSLRHYQLRNFDNGGSASYQLLPFLNTAGAT